MCDKTITQSKITWKHQDVFVSQYIWTVVGISLVYMYTVGILCHAQQTEKTEGLPISRSTKNLVEQTFQALPHSAQQCRI